MCRAISEHYFYSIEPFWNTLPAYHPRRSPSNDFMMLNSRHGTQPINCVPGNGQIGLILQQTDDGITGKCYGVLKERREVVLRGQEDSDSPLYLLCFAPGSFAKICRMPMNLIDPCGIEVSDVFSREQLERIQSAAALEDADEQLFRLFNQWIEAGSLSAISARNITDEVIRTIWVRKGNVQIRELEEHTLYSARYLEKLIINNVGITPKQMCNQIRFQHAMHLLKNEQGISHKELALQLGYNDQAHYCKVFKRYSGRTPAEYVSQNKI